MKRFLRIVPAFEMMVESGIILLKYWLEVTVEEQTRRLAARIEDGRKIWKLSRMEVKLPRRQKAHGYREPAYPYKLVPEKF